MNPSRQSSSQRDAVLAVSHIAVPGDVSPFAENAQLAEILIGRLKSIVADGGR